VKLEYLSEVLTDEEKKGSSIEPPLKKRIMIRRYDKPKKTLLLHRIMDWSMKNNGVNPVFFKNEGCICDCW
jgi:hypothetical protein